MHFEFSTTSKIIFGSGRLNSIGDLAVDLGHNTLVISGCPREISDRLTNLLETRGIRCTVVKVKPEPTLDSIRELVELCKQTHSDMVIGIGGGSAIDSAKTTAVLMTNPGDVSNYLEVIGQNQPLVNPAIPVIAIPTTAGTGAEVTRNAVLESPTHHVKVSLRSPHLLPRIALVDPELTLSLPPSVTASSGLDALTQLIEPFTCNTPNPLVDALCREGIQRVARSIYRAFDDGNDLNARQDMSLASLFSGLALANARLGAVHGFAGPLGGEISAPHGTICGCLLPYVMEANLAALKEREADHPVLRRYHEIAELLTGKAGASAEMGANLVRDFCQYAQIPRLSQFGLAESMFDTLVSKAVNASSMKGNPITLSELELRNILQKCLLPKDEDIPSLPASEIRCKLSPGGEHEHR